MGWFWADGTASSRLSTSHPSYQFSASPPPECPMHNSARPFPAKSSSSHGPSSCPVASSDSPSSSSDPSTFSKLNPLNYMPTSISQARSPNQRTILTTTRETSSIPRCDDRGNWVYPSPQQMYNAMLRKGYDDTPEDAVESMVAVHNFLNEGAWGEIEGWESRFSKGLRQGWENCKNGEEGFKREMEKEEEKPRLIRFMGRPEDLTPKALLLSVWGWAFPKKYNKEFPFDRHDWIVQRQCPDGRQREIRYVIDYYSGPEEPTGEPVFYLDVRPAIDSPTAAAERLLRYGCDIWYRASGAKGFNK